MGIVGNFLAGLCLVFITLRLTNYIDWNWLWVLSPIWIPMALFVLSAILVGIYEGFKENKEE